MWRGAAVRATAAAPTVARAVAVTAARSSVRRAFSAAAVASASNRRVTAPAALAAARAAAALPLAHAHAYGWCVPRTATAAVAVAAACVPRRVHTSAAAVLRAAAASGSSAGAAAPAAAVSAATSASTAASSGDAGATDATGATGATGGFPVTAPGLRPLGKRQPKAPRKVSAVMRGWRRAMEAVQAPLSPKAKEDVRQYLALIKDRLTFGVLWSCVATGGVSAWAFGTGSYPVAVAATVGTYCCIAGANIFNQLIEIERDRKMFRTARRPLVTGYWSRSTAVGLGVAHAAAGGALLYAVNTPLAVIGLGTLVLYAGPYTLLKPVTKWNTWVGAVVGSAPPVMGVAAAMPAAALPGVCSGLLAIALHPFAIWAFAYQFAWQMLHFYPLQYDARDDYRRGGYQMLSVDDPLAARTSVISWRWTLLTTAMSLWAPWVGLTSPMGAVTMLLLHIPALVLARRFVTASRAAVAAAARYGVSQEQYSQSDGEEAVRVTSASTHLWVYSIVLMIAVYGFLLFHSAPLRVTADSWAPTRAVAWANALGAKLCIHNRWHELMGASAQGAPHPQLSPAQIAAEQHALATANTAVMLSGKQQRDRSKCAYAAVADSVGKAGDAAARTGTAAAAAIPSPAPAAKVESKRA